MQLSSFLQTAITRLQQASVSEPEANAEFLLAHVLGVSRSWIWAHGDFELSAAQKAQFEQLLTRKEKGEPLAYIIGVQPFCGLDIAVSPAVLIPRPETENLVELASAFFAKNGRYTFLDMCTGSGCIACVLAKKFPQSRVLAVDISPQALQIAAQNIKQHKLQERVELLQSNLWENVMGTFDLIISNPPYIPTENLQNLSQEVRQEPRLALDGGADGFALTRPLCSAAADYLNKGGLLALELDDGQAWPLARGLAEIGWQADVKKDIFNVERFVLAHFK